VIEDKLGEHISSFSYPYAFPETYTSFTSYLRHTLNSVGYKNGVTTVVGGASLNDAPFFLKRILINSLDDISLFKAKVEGGYDWMRYVQRSVKYMKTVALLKNRSRISKR